MLNAITDKPPSLQVENAAGELSVTIADMPITCPTKLFLNDQLRIEGADGSFVIIITRIA